MNTTPNVVYDPRMIKMNRTTGCGLPFEITAKTLQRLKDYELIQSESSVKPGAPHDERKGR